MRECVSVSVICYAQRPLAPSSDCFYDACSRISGLDVKSLREVVANDLEQPQLDTFRMLCEAGVEDYDFVRARHNRKRKRGARSASGSGTRTMDNSSKMWEDLEGVRDKLRVSGKDAGATACVWADEWAMRIVCQHLELGIVSAYSISSFLLALPISIRRAYLYHRSCVHS